MSTAEGDVTSVMVSMATVISVYNDNTGLYEHYADCNDLNGVKG